MASGKIVLRSSLERYTSISANNALLLRRIRPSSQKDLRSRVSVLRRSTFKRRARSLGFIARCVIVRSGI